MKDHPSGISSLQSFGSQSSRSLQIYLVNRLQLIFTDVGWKTWTMPSKRRLQKMVVLDSAGMWPTPMKCDGMGTIGHGYDRKPGEPKEHLSLSGQVKLLDVAKVPSVYSNQITVADGSNLSLQRYRLSLPDIYNAVLDKSLNPGLSRWLQGLPPIWDKCAKKAGQLLKKVD